ncbi:uncharacterized protein FA14DRAFT_152567 [Meira miltonrushii]|uniref:Uncharacterized protein n=1 Tax=Meira miltonrushii TaxID=1280837 RepID=A0A316VJC0_9BASI|nr:uncharacterized protein FA14DRAFT_152567 [Meira miltonrushii]PWN37158.1 hypothetical protein FA14DRAFT_152567 [Meira miltonrushii]
MSSGQQNEKIARSVQSINTAFQLFTTDDVEKQVFNEKAGPLAMAVSMLGYPGQAGLVRASLKLIVGLEKAHASGLDVSMMKHLTPTPIDRFTSGQGDPIGLNPREDQILLKHFLNDYKGNVWYYFGARPDKNDQRWNRTVTCLTYGCFLFCALITGISSVPLCWNKGVVYWILVMLNPLGLCILAVTFIQARTGIRPAEIHWQNEDGPDPPNCNDPRKYPKLPHSIIFDGDRIGIIDERAIDIYPLSTLRFKIALAVGTSCLLIGFLVAFTLIQDNDLDAIIWVTCQLVLTGLRYVVWLLEPLRMVQRLSKEMGIEANTVAGDICDFTDEATARIVFLIARKRIYDTIYGEYFLSRYTEESIWHVLSSLPWAEAGNWCQHKALKAEEVYAAVQDEQTILDQLKKEANQRAASGKATNVSSQAPFRTVEQSKDTTQSRENHRVIDMQQGTSNNQIILIPLPIIYAMCDVLGLKPLSCGLPTMSVLNNYGTYVTLCLVTRGSMVSFLLYIGYFPAMEGRLFGFLPDNEEQSTLQLCSDLRLEFTGGILTKASQPEVSPPMEDFAREKSSNESFEKLLWSWKQNTRQDKIINSRADLPLTASPRDEDSYLVIETRRNHYLYGRSILRLFIRNSQDIERRKRIRTYHVASKGDGNGASSFWRNRANIAIGGTAQRLGGTAQRLGGTAQRLGGTAQRLGGTAQRLETLSGPKTHSVQVNPASPTYHTAATSIISDDIIREEEDWAADLVEVWYEQRD